MLWNQSAVSTAFYLGADRGWVRDPWGRALADVPWPDNHKRALMAWLNDSRQYMAPGDQPPATGDLISWRMAVEKSATARWLDSMSYRDFITNVMGLDAAAIARYADPIIAVSIGGLGSDAISAYGAQRILLPGAAPAPMRQGFEHGFSYPIGNAVYARHLVKAMRPDVYANADFATMVYGATDMARLDLPQAQTRIRLNATVVRVAHVGPANQADGVSVVYHRNGQLHNVTARAVVMASGGWVNRRIIADMPDDLAAAYDSFNHAPILVANVAVRHWRFLDKLGCSAVRWFDGLGFFTNLTKPMRIAGKPQTFTPDMPAMLTFYIPFLANGLGVAEQASLGRQSLFQTTFADYERTLRRQMQEMFGSLGFDARRDIAAIILNRWGHAYVVPEPGFFFGRGTAPAPRDVVRRGYGRIAFAHAELQGNQSWTGAYFEAVRAVGQISAL
jgi:spermidine dehydrogenase